MDNKPVKYEWVDFDNTGYNDTEYTNNTKYNTKPSITTHVKKKSSKRNCCLYGLR